jgi:hypothetical protein
MSSLVINTETGEASVKPATSSEAADIKARNDAWTADTDKRNAQALLEKHDAKGYTRAWETSVAPLVAAGTLPEYDKTIYDEKVAARAVVKG